MMIDPAKHRSLLLPAAAGIVVLWAILNVAEIRGAWARNEGFLAFNRSRAEIAADSDRTRQGIHSLKQATNLNPDGDSAWRALGYLLLEQDNTEEALAAWHHSEGMAAELFNNGTRAKASGSDDQALAWYEHAVALAPEMVNGWMEIGLIHERRGDLQTAMDAFTAGLEATPDNSDLTYHVGRLHMNIDQPVDWQTVLAWAEHAIAQGNFLHDWSRYQSHYVRGEALRNLGREREALDEYEKVTEGLPTYYWGMLRRAELTWRVEADTAMTEQYYLAAIDLAPNSKWAYRHYARDLAAMGRQDEARLYFEKVLSLDPGDQVAADWLRQNPQDTRP